MVNGVSGAARPYPLAEARQASRGAAASGLAQSCRGCGMSPQARPQPAMAGSQAGGFQSCLDGLRRDLGGASAMLCQLSGDAGLPPKQQAQAGQLAQRLDGLSQALEQGNRLALAASLIGARGV